MTIKECIKEFENLTNEIDNLFATKVAYSQLDFEQKISGMFEKFYLLEFLRNIKYLKSDIQKMEHLLEKEYKTEPGHEPEIIALINAINITPKQYSFKHAFNYSKRVSVAKNQLKKIFIRSIKRLANNLIPEKIDITDPDNDHDNDLEEVDL